jgi:hypothetical protein
MSVQISVIGGSNPPSWAIEAAEEVGRLIAKNGAILICGGMGGVMEAACRGAKSAGGLTIGIIPYYEKERANPYLDIVIPTGLGLSRNTLVVASGDVIIAVDGHWGTFSEIALAKNLGKGIVALGVNHDFAGIEYADTPEEAVNIAFNLIGG